MKTRRMKQLVFTLLAMALLLPVKGMAATASLKIEDFTINANETKEMLIDLENPDMEITLVQFDLCLPQGLSIANGDDDIDIAGRTTWKKHALNMNAQDDGTIRFLLASQKNEIISGTSGAIISIMLTAGRDFKGGDIRLENIKLVAPDANATTIKPADYAYTVTTGVVADDVTLTAKSYTREYGEENPDFEYEVTSGSITSGTPTITCSATKTSPVGTYPIVIREGSVSNSNVNLVNGTLTITKAPLTISAGDYTKEEGEANPTFTPTFSGFKNGETKSVLTKQPTITTTATTSSPAGIYPVTVSGAEAQNYDISYVNGTLTVTKKEDPTPELVTPPANLKTETYYVTGKSKYWDGDEQVWTPSDIFGDVQIGFDNNDVYIQGLCEYFGDAWVKGTRSGNNIVFPTGQYMGTDEGYDCYFVGQNKNTGAIVDVILNYNAQTGEYTLPNILWILNSADKTSLCYSFYYELLLSKTFMTVYVEEAGTLSSSISNEMKYQLEGLKVYGQLNSTDFRLLRDMAGSDYMNNATQGKLKKLDMENAEIVTGGEDYLEWGYAGTWHIENNNELGNSVFYGCKKLEEVVLPEGLKSIKRDAFKNCDNLTSVAFNDGLTSLGDGVFSHTKLVNVELPDNLTTMGAAVFYGCQDLVSTTIPKNLQKPLSQTFVDCKNLRSVYSHLLNPEGLFGNTNHTAFDYYDANYNLLFTNATLYVPAGTKNLYEQAEGWKKFSNIVEIDGGQEEEVTVALDNSCKIDNYWYGLDGSYNGLDALIMSASAPMSGQQFDEWKVTLSNCFLAGKLRFTVTGGDSNAVEGRFAFRSEGDFVANEDGTVLQYADGNGLQPIAELNATTGELQLMKNETMKRLINAFPSTPVKDALALPLCVKATYNGKEVEVENGAFTVFVKRPVNAEDSGTNEPIDGMTFQWEFELVDLVKLFDYRGNPYGLFDKTANPNYSTNLYYYYGVKSIAITNATTENFKDIVTTNLYAEENTFRPFSSVRSYLSLNYSPSGYTFGWNDYGEEAVSYGKLSLTDNGNGVPPFTLRVPITVTYEWGTVEAIATINFGQTEQPDIIAFADAEVKRICVENWDTNGDGELSKEEAEAVTDLEGVFENNMIIESFNELRFFTGLTTIRAQEFNRCTHLGSIILPEGLLNIGRDAFSNCPLAEITIPASVTSIDETGLNTCFKNIYVDPNSNSYCSIDGVLFSKDATLLHTYPIMRDEKSYSIPNSVTTIGACAFYGSKLYSVTIPYGVENIKRSAFRYNRNLESVSIPSSVKTLETDCFEFCEGLTTFYIPSSVISIGASALSACSSMTEITVDANNEYFTSMEGILYNKEKTKLLIYPAGKPNATYIIPSTITTIQMASCYWCKNLNAVVIPQSVSSIGWFAFVQCDNLSSVTVHHEMPISIGESVFGTNTKNNGTLYVPKGSKERYQEATGWKDFVNIVEIGDINCDGKVDVSDYIGVANHILGQTPEGFNEPAADVNGDGVIDVSDYIGIANIILTGNIYGGK